MENRFAIAIVALLFPVVCGCGGGDELQKYPVKGTVTYKGQPVLEGNVSFRNEDHGSGGVIGADGTFEVEGGLPAGKYNVYISPPDIMEAPTFGRDGKAPPKPKPYPNIPQKYRLPATSDLTADVKEGTNDVKLEMQ